MGVSGAYEFSPGRAAAADAAVDLMREGTTIGLGSGRAVWAVIEAIGARWPARPAVEAVVASEATFAIARAAGIPVRQLDGGVELDMAVDGADELDRDLRLMKGGGGALLREKIVAAGARRFVVVAEKKKLVERLGAEFRLPVEVVRFGWRDTRRRLEPLLHCAVPPEADLDELNRDLKLVTGVVEHGLFVGMAERALLGTDDGRVEAIEPAA